MDPSTARRATPCSTLCPTRRKLSKVSRNPRDSTTSSPAERLAVRYGRTMYSFSAGLTTKSYLSNRSMVQGSRPPRPLVSPHLRLASQIARPSLRSEEHTSELQSQFHLVCRL